MKNGKIVFTQEEVDKAQTDAYVLQGYLTLLHQAIIHGECLDEVLPETQCLNQDMIDRAVKLSEMFDRLSTKESEA
jgi:hypothetical protein